MRWCISRPQPFSWGLYLGPVIIRNGNNARLRAHVDPISAIHIISNLWSRSVVCRASRGEQIDIGSRAVFEEAVWSLAVVRILTTYKSLDHTVTFESRKTSQYPAPGEQNPGAQTAHPNSFPQRSFWPPARASRSEPDSWRAARLEKRLLCLIPAT